MPPLSTSDIAILGVLLPLLAGALLQAWPEWTGWAKRLERLKKAADPAPEPELEPEQRPELELEPEEEPGQTDSQPSLETPPEDGPPLPADSPASLTFAQSELDRFWNSRKTSVELGRLYERYIGYLHEKLGCEVEYFGIENGKHDLGRDLICRKGRHTWVVQCKRWSLRRTVQVRYIHQLHGTAAQYAAEHPREVVHSAFYSTATKFSLESQNAAYLLGVRLGNYPMKRFPIIKCQHGDNGENFFYLPFDREYDSVRLRPDRGDFYCETVGEAERRGFRWRANPWRAADADTEKKGS